MTKKHYLALSLVSMLVACGGEDEVNLPMANADHLTLTDNQPILAQVLANDSRGDSSAIELDKILTTPSQSEVAIVGDAISITPNADATGKDSFEYQITDGEQTSSATVTVVYTSSPIAMDDMGTVLNGQVITIDAIANDSDLDGDALSIISISDGIHGQASVVDNTIQYSPNATALGKEILTYVVSDGLLTTEATITIDLQQSFTINGQVIETPYVGDKVSLEVPGTTFDSTIQQDGSYTLDVVVSSPDSPIVLNTIAADGKNIDYIDVATYLGTAQEIITGLNDERVVANADLSYTTMSSYLFATAGLGKSGLSQYAHLNDYTIATESVAEQLTYQYAAWIKLLNEATLDTAPPLPFGFSSLSKMFELADDTASTKEIWDKFLSEGSYLFQSNGWGWDFPMFKSMHRFALAAIVERESPQLLTSAMVANKEFILSDVAREGLFSADGSGLTFADGVFSNSLVGLYSQTITGEYSVTDNDALVLGNPLEGFNSWNTGFNIYSVDYLRRELLEYGFSKSYIDTVAAVAQEQFDLGNTVSLDLAQHAGETKLHIIDTDISNYEIAEVQYSEREVFLVIDGVSTDSFGKEAVEKWVDYYVMEFDVESLFADKDLSELAGKWVLNTLQDTEFYFNSVYNAAVADVFIISTESNQVTSQQFGDSYEVSLINGVLSLTNDSVRYDFVPYKQNGKYYKAKFIVTDDAGVRFGAVDLIKFDESAVAFESNLVTEFPYVWAADLFGIGPLSQSGDMPDLEGLWAYQFNSDGTMNRGISGNLWEYGYSILMGDSNYTWELVDGVIATQSIRERKEDYRTWLPIAIEEDGSVYVLEQHLRGDDDYYGNGDGVVSPDEVKVYFPYRINKLRQIDLSNYGDVWDDSYSNWLNNQ
ncbi:Ig-like domain-containing protein [Paraferrimonas sp. SM1919]|uniref:Ig-like domain-containing protein n=1 Tax=Paraferrimonas sp. SM1919 TaxID=2662263 RepID=UPI0013D82974|nr:Ig-like domain-containing protein [Paraferrimonas sp. SM1919]